MATPPVKAYTIDELCKIYGITRKQFYSWRELFREKVGELKAHKYTPAQVKIIFEHVGYPEDLKE